MTRPNPAFWAGKRVLLTGHTGFKGSWAAVWLAQMGAQVTGLSLAPDQTPALFDRAGVADLVDLHFVDLRDQAAVEALASDRQFDLVLHMAAQPIVRTSIEDPVSTFASNIMGTAHLLQALRAQPALAAALVVTSDKVYANNEQGRAFQEADALGGKDPYSASRRRPRSSPNPSPAASTRRPASRWPPPAAATSSAAATFPATGWWPTSSEPARPRPSLCCATPRRRAPGSMSWTASPATSSIWSGWPPTRPRRAP